MRSTKDPLTKRHRALEEWPRPLELALFLKQSSQIIETDRRARILGSKGSLMDRQRAFEQLPCSGKIALVL
jgi:hypothetical protein